MAVFFSILTYVINGNLLQVIAMAILIFAFDAAQRLFEIKQGLPRRTLWERPAVLPHFWQRVIQTLIITVWWALAMSLMVWPGNVWAVLVGTAIFGTGMFLYAEWEAWQTRR